MASIAITQAAFAGFGVLRRKPWAPLVWSVVYVLAVAAVVLFLGAAFIGAFGRLMLLGPKASAADIFALLGAVVGGYFLLVLVLWVVGAIINMAVVRAVLAPEDAAFAYLRFGRAELWLMLANLVLFILYMVVSFALAIPVALIGAVATLASHDAAPFVSLLVQLVTWAVSIWLMLRFSMMAPMIFTERRFRLFESWTLTRGHAWSLFGVGVVVALVSLAVYVALAALGFAIGVPLFQSLHLGPTAEGFFSQPPQAIWNALAPLLALYAVLAFVASVILTPLFFAAWPEAYRQLTRGDLAATFS